MPRTQSQAISNSDAPCRVTSSGKVLADLFKENQGRVYDHLLLAWVNQHPYFRMLLSRLNKAQGQRSRKRCPGYHFQQEVFTPTTSATLHHDAILPQMLLQQRQREPIQSRKILTQVLVANPRFVLAVRHVQTPVTTILDPPMTPHRMRKQLRAHVQTADVMANSHRLLPRELPRHVCWIVSRRRRTPFPNGHRRFAACGP